MQEQEATKRRTCPDEGTCHHECEGAHSSTCFRVQHCEPLSGVFPNDVWPLRLRRPPPSDLEQALTQAILAVEVQQDRSNHVKIHCPNLGPYTRLNPKHCIDCGKLGSFWTASDEPCPATVSRLR